MMRNESHREMLTNLLRATEGWYENNSTEEHSAAVPHSDRDSLRNIVDRLTAGQLYVQNATEPSEDELEWDPPLDRDERGMSPHELHYQVSEVLEDPASWRPEEPPPASQAAKNEGNPEEKAASSRGAEAPRDSAPLGGTVTTDTNPEESGQK